LALTQAGRLRDARHRRRQETAFRVHANSGPGSTVLYEGNRVEGAEVGVLWTLGGNLSAFDPIRFVGNTFVDGGRAFVVGSGGAPSCGATGSSITPGRSTFFETTARFRRSATGGAATKDPTFPGAFP